MTEISNINVHILTACLNKSVFKHLFSSINVIRFRDAKLQAVLSKNIYSEQGFEALISPLSGHVCQSLIVVWN